MKKHKNHYYIIYNSHRLIGLRIANQFQQNISYYPRTCVRYMDVRESTWTYVWSTTHVYKNTQIFRNFEEEKNNSKWNQTGSIPFKTNTSKLVQQ